MIEDTLDDVSFKESLYSIYNNSFTKKLKEEKQKKNWALNCQLINCLPGSCDL